MTLPFYITISVLFITLLPLIHLCFLFILFMIPKMVEGIYRLTLFIHQHIAAIALYTYIGYVCYIMLYHCFYYSMDEFGMGFIEF